MNGLSPRQIPVHMLVSLADKYSCNLGVISVSSRKQRGGQTQRWLRNWLGSCDLAITLLDAKGCTTKGSHTGSGGHNCFSVLVFIWFVVSVWYWSALPLNISAISVDTSPGCNRNGWLGVKHQVTYSVYTMQLCTSLQCHFIQSHIGRVHVTLTLYYCISTVLLH